MATCRKWTMTSLFLSSQSAFAMYCLQWLVALSDPYLFTPEVSFGQLILTVVGLFAFFFVLEYVKMINHSSGEHVLCLPLPFY